MTSPDVSISGPISPAQAEVLRNDTRDPEAAGRVLESIGATAHTKAVALVVSTDEKGAETPQHFVTLDPNDLGTELEPETGAADLGLPHPEHAHAELQAKAQAAEAPQPEVK